MCEYEFVLKIDLPSETDEPQPYLDALFKNGCDDAIPGVNRMGSIVLNFNREAVSAEDAKTTAVHDVRKAIPQARGVEFVGTRDWERAMGGFALFGSV